MSSGEAIVQETKEAIVEESGEDTVQETVLEIVEETEENIEDIVREAGRVGDIELLVNLVPNANTNSKNAVNGWNVLHGACQRSQASVVRFLLDKSANKSAPSAHGIVASQLATTEESRQLQREIVLKARVANSEDPDFIEVELDTSKRTFEGLTNLLCSELGVDKRMVGKIRKLPNTALRKDKDVQRLRDFEELELELTQVTQRTMSTTPQKTLTILDPSTLMSTVRKRKSTLQMDTPDVKTLTFMPRSSGRRPNMADFDGLSLIEIGTRFKSDRFACIQFCRQQGLLAEKMECPACKIPCTEGRIDMVGDGVVWLCLKCKRRINTRKGSAFEGSKLDLWQILGLTYKYSISMGNAKGLSVEQTMHELGIESDRSVIDWNQFCGEIAVTYFLDNPVQVGGPGHIVEIDESFSSKRKSVRGRPLSEQYVFGGYDPTSKRGFLIPVPERDAATLFPIIQQWVLPGSEIWSDMWEEYNSLQASILPNQSIHRYSFVNPNMNVKSNPGESFWLKNKPKTKVANGAEKKEILPDSFAEFVWIQQFGDHRLYHLWNQIASLFPL